MDEPPEDDQFRGFRLSPGVKSGIQRMNRSEAFAFRIDPEGIQRMTGDGSERLRASMISRGHQADDLF